MSGGAIERRYTDAQRDALAVAYEDRGIRPAAAIVALAATGDLVEGLEPFTVANDQTVHKAVATLRKRRAGMASSAIGKLPPRDATERLRRTLAERIDEELEREGRKPKGKRDMEKLRQIGRAINEHARIPAPRDTVSTTTIGSGSDRGEQGATRGGIAGPLLTAHRGSGQTAHEGDNASAAHTDNASDGVAAGQQHHNDTG